MNCKEMIFLCRQNCKGIAKMTARTSNPGHARPMSKGPKPMSTRATRVLVVDDDPKLCRLIRRYLEPQGFKVDVAHTGPAGLEAVLKTKPEAVILDVMLPGMDGFAVLEGIRAKSEVPVIMLTGRGEEADRVKGLELGADDYLPKTFSPRELLARLRAVLRRSQRASAREEPELVEYKNGPLRVLPEARTAMLGDAALELTPLEYDLLLSLIRGRGRVRSREQLLNDIAGREHAVFDRTIDVHISALRQKLGDNPKAPRFIRTVRAVGYLMLDHDAPSA
jgi:DNA-binding response OmpR family regulator